jgi:hypothetical protein
LNIRNRLYQVVIDLMHKGEGRASLTDGKSAAEGKVQV